ncbi:MAG: hypothetical protein J6C46_05205 [Clostridia bacterium]|nr:hypothetical protein [Clostridia bacterium]
MAENEVKKEKATLKISIWFLLFLIYLIFSLAFGASLINENKSLKAELTNKDNTIIDIQNTNQNDINKLLSTIDSVSNMLADAKNEILAKEEQNKTVEVSTGVYTGSSAESGENAVSMTLTLAENNIATLSVVNNAGESLYNGTYSLADSLVNFTSDDGLTAYSFTAVEDGSLVNNEMQVTLNK